MDILGSAFNSGVNTIQSGQRRVDQAAASIAGAPANTPPSPLQTPPQQQVNPSAEIDPRVRPDLTESLVDLRVGQNEAQLGARVVKTADDLLGTLIDTTA
jgi:hypothetical protein